MTRWSLVVTSSVFAGALLPAPTALAADPITVADGLRFPAGIAFDSTGTMFVTEREGRILAFEGKSSKAVATIPTITQGETGLLGITVSPDDRYVYVFATEADATNTIWRVEVAGGRPERVITGLPGSTYHNGGGVAFGSDGMLYVSNGERHSTTLSQDPEVLGGKVYRYTPDGRIPEDNPFGTSPAYSIGHRNPFGLAIDPVSGDPFVTENGPEAHDEINHIVAGGNYGWPLVSGTAKGETAGIENYHDPLSDYEQIIVPTGIAFADPATAVPAVAGDLFFGTYGDQTIHRLVLDEARAEVRTDDVWFRSPEPVIAMAWGPRGLYYSTPGAVKLFALAKDPSRGDSAGSVDAPPPDDRGALGDAAGEESRGRSVAPLLFGGALLVLVAALAYAFGGNRRGRA
jgi:glucose/arabinose dehydrogenase